MTHIEKALIDLIKFKEQNEQAIHEAGLTSEFMDIEDELKYANDVLNEDLVFDGTIALTDNEYQTIWNKRESL